MRLVLAAALASMALPACAHEYVVLPAAMRATPGQPLAVAAVSAHVFIKSVELEDATDSRAGIWADGRRTAVALTPDAAALVHRGTAAAPAEGCFIVTGNRAGQVWSSTPQGTRRVGREAPGAANVRMIEKFSKAIVNAGANDTGCLQPIGDRLEVLTTANPATIKPGDDIAVQVLFDGKPLTTPVYATYDGFSGEENTYAYYTEGRPDGTARVRITQPGIWMIRVEHTSNQRTDQYDRYLARAVLLFEVK